MIRIRHLIGALFYSFAGLRRAWANEQAFKHESLLLPVILLLLAFIRPGLGWTAALIAAWLFVMALELLNSAIEEVCNLVSPEYNIHIKYGKDMASAAIFMGLLANAFLWLCMLWDKIA